MSKRKKRGSCGKRESQCRNHQPVVDQSAFVRQGWHTKNMLTLREVWRLIPQAALLLGVIKRGGNMGVLAFGRRFAEGP